MWIQDENNRIIYYTAGVGGSTFVISALFNGVLYNWDTKKVIKQSLIAISVASAAALGFSLANEKIKPKIK